MIANQKRKVIVISASSDIGVELCARWKSKNWEVFGTYRTESSMTNQLKANGVQLIHCDLLSKKNIKRLCLELKSICTKWDVLILCPGTQNPIGPFKDVDFKEWEESINVNFVRQLNIVHGLLPQRNTESKEGPCVLFFAGGGTNNATLNYSAYTLSKIALIKMCELLDAEITDSRFVIVGPGWVKTKIHEETLSAGEKAGDNYQKTKVKLTGKEWTEMNDVVDCCEWLISAPKHIISGRNFSVVFDQWGSDELKNLLKNDHSMYKLRRHGNNFLTNN
jgi:short-subunit dehydrogenase